MKYSGVSRYPARLTPPESPHPWRELLDADGRRVGRGRFIADGFIEWETDSGEAVTELVQRAVPPIDPVPYTLGVLWS